MSAVKSPTSIPSTNIFILVGQMMLQQLGDLLRLNGTMLASILRVEPFVSCSIYFVTSSLALKLSFLAFLQGHIFRTLPPPV